MDNVYNNPEFFEAYSKMGRSQQGLAGAGEWHQLKVLLPELSGKQVLDLGCGYGWHCKFAADRGARAVLGIDGSEKMIAEAKKRNADPNIQYAVCDLLDYGYPEGFFDCVISNLVLHYIEDLDEIYPRIFKTLKPGGVFVVNIEHPTFTAGVNQTWVVDGEGKPQFWPVDNYYLPGLRQTEFLGHQVHKYHHTLTQILGGLLAAGFVLEAVEEAVPPENRMHLPGMSDELRRPMMLLVRARKPE